MFKFSKKSLERLSTVDKRLKDLFNEVIKYYDCSVICGYRTQEEQELAFKQGNSKCDGVIKKSKHQLRLAVDVTPYPIDWTNLSSFYELAGCIKTIAKQFDIDIIWGGDWKFFKDYPHWEIKE